MRTAADDIRAYDAYCDNLNSPPQEDAPQEEQDDESGDDDYEWERESVLDTMDPEIDSL